MEYPWQKKKDVSESSSSVVSTNQLRELLCKEADILRELKHQEGYDSIYITEFITSSESMQSRHSLVDISAIKKVVIEELQRQLDEVETALRRCGLK